MRRLPLKAMEVLNKIEKLKAELDSLRPIDREAEQRIMQKFRLDWNYHSNSLEGNSLTYGETKALILFGITAQGKPLKDHFEITGHDEAIKWIEDIIKEEIPLTENFIRELNLLILKEPSYTKAVTLDNQPTQKRIEPGKYKTMPNHVLTRTGETFYFASPEETPARMYDLIEWFREKKPDVEINPVVLAAEFHYKFILIHPFDDGNGRTARILMNFILMQHGYPPVIIKTEDKENYYSVLRQADAGILESFIEYIAQNLVRSLETMIKGAKGESIEEPDDLDKELALLERRLQTIKEKEFTKDKESILELFDHSVIPLLREFSKMCSKFDRFYFENKAEFLIDQVAPFNIMKPELFVEVKMRREIEEKMNLPTSISFLYSYTNFRQSGFDNIQFETKINFVFELSEYEISCHPGGRAIRKLYFEQLSNNEIKDIVNYAANKHKGFIKNELEVFEEKEKKTARD